ncbi:MAG: undecaprenyl/decaprenyl-phosphate alpha-N-acetylglucosaminyl 1-phosphate transferase [Phycisphaerales bacterium]|nr:undecaprenyl/decaprenyl-phosphate alpha-N-acetylglucosaminyl 1-phosphate transferase [Phycisphaerales bacterium]
MISVLLGQVGRPFTADEVLSPYIYVFYVAFVVAFIFTPIMRSVAMYYGIIDEPDRIRKMHAVPVAYLGGVAVFLGWVCGLAVSQFLRLHQVPLGWTTTHLVIKFSIVVGACCIVLLGLWDDILRLKPSVKIMGQVLAAVILLADGIGTKLAEPVMVPVSLLLHNRFGMPLIPDWFMVAVSGIMVICIVVFCCNATNLMDGLDGLCGGVTGVISAGLLFLAIHLAMAGSGLNTNWDGLRVVLGLALLGAVLGFVPYNFNPASIFMGDTGSMFLGFCCAVMIILMGQGQHPKWFMASTVMFALPVLDTMLAFTRRYVNGRPLFSADKFHIHHQLVARGFSVKQTVMIMYGLAIFFALLGASIVYMRTRYVGAIYLVIFGSIIVAAYKMGMVHEKPRSVVRRDLSSSEVIASTSAIEPGSVLEIKDEPAAAADEGTWATPHDSTPMKIG